MSAKNLSMDERFWSKANKGSNGSCWIWTSTRNSCGYGTFTVDKNTRAGAHRMAYELSFGKIPAGLCVLHKCDNPACVNPDHLYLGTHSDNMKDKAKKGRCRSGVLSKQQIQEIKKSNDPVLDLVNKYGVTGRVICYTRKGR